MVYTATVLSQHQHPLLALMAAARKRLEAKAGWLCPDPITFIVAPEYLNRPNLYPRQATLIKVIFLREDLFTQYDYDVVAEWEESFRKTGNNGICPNILERMRLLTAQGYPWFREILLVLGRRGGKGYITALCMAYVLWKYMGFGDPQDQFGVDRDKKLTLMCFAAKRDQAKVNVWTDINNVILGSTCFAPYVSKALGESLSVKAPNDDTRAEELVEKGIVSAADMSSFTIVPKESTLTAGRGPASFAQVYDEMAHVVNAGANRSAEEVYCLDPMTRVLKADLTWVTIDSLEPGDVLVALDEDAPGMAGTPRKLREATVLHRWDTEGAAYRIHLEDGTSVVCSGNHRWLRSRGAGGNTRWASIVKPAVLRDGAGGNWAQLRVGDSIKHLVDPWGVDQSREAGYLSGIYDGEGHVRFDARGSMKIGFAQNPGPVRDHVVGLLEAAGFDLKHDKKSTKCQSFQITGLANCFRFLGTYQPMRLAQNARDLWQGRAVRGSDGSKRVIAIEELPAQRLVDIETSTGTFIAEGLVSHNSAATPSLDQFGKYAMIIEPSSPWQMMGQFYENYQNSILLEDGSPVYPEMLMLQLTSWDIYVDWEKAHLIPLFPDGFRGDKSEYYAPDEYSKQYPDGPLDPFCETPIKPYPRLKQLRGAIQAYDDQMARLERSNPETFKVERRSHFAAALDAYLNAELVEKVFLPWEGRPAHYGPPSLQEAGSGLLAISYKGHGDPSKVNDKFGIAVAHVENDPEGRAHCVFDLLKHFDPADFDGGIIDYEEVDDWIWDNIIKKFYPEEFTFDQYNSTSSIQRLQKKVRNNSLPKRVNIFEKTTTRPYDWTVKENSKAAINLGLVHAPSVITGESYERAELELRFLQLVNGRVDHPSAGPVQSKDIADAMTECIHVLIGEQVNNFVHADMARMGPVGVAQEGFTPFEGAMDRAELDVMRGMSGFGRARGARDMPRERLARGRARRSRS